MEQTQDCPIQETESTAAEATEALPSQNLELVQPVRREVSRQATTTGLIPKNLTEVMQLANMLANSSMVPDCYQGEPGNVVAAIQMGSEMGIPPMSMLRLSYPVNNRIGLYTDLLMAVVMAQANYAGQTVLVETDEECRILLHRRLPDGSVCDYEGQFDVKQAKACGLWGKSGPWSGIPKVMLRHRATAFAARRGWPDKLAGVYTVEELISIDSGNGGATLRNVTENPLAGDLNGSVEQTVIVGGMVDEAWQRVQALAKEAGITGKALTDLRQRWKAVKNNKAAAAKLEKYIMDEIETRKLKVVISD